MNADESVRVPVNCMFTDIAWLFKLVKPHWFHEAWMGKLSPELLKVTRSYTGPNGREPQGDFDHDVKFVFFVDWRGKLVGEVGFRPKVWTEFPCANSFDLFLSSIGIVGKMNKSLPGETFLGAVTRLKSVAHQATNIIIKDDCCQGGVRKGRLYVYKIPSGHNLLTWTKSVKGGIL